MANRGFLGFLQESNEIRIRICSGLPRKGGVMRADLLSQLSEISRRQPSPLRDPGDHAGADLLVVVEREDDICPAGTRQDAVRADLPLERPA